MHVFGSHWQHHAERLAEAWREQVGPEDVVLMPGDFSWAMRLEEAHDDFAYLAQLPGRVLMIRGNHDYWWQSIGRVRKALPANAVAIQNDHVPLKDGWAVCGTRGWALPGSDGYSDDDRRIYERELQRLQLSLNSAVRAGHDKLIVMIHYPPAQGFQPSEFTALMEQAPVRLCVYGHLHEAGAQRRAVRGNWRGVRYELVACDAVGFRPLYLLEV